MADPTWVTQAQVLEKIAKIFDVSFPAQEKLLAAYLLRNPSQSPPTREGGDNPKRGIGSGAPYSHMHYTRPGEFKGTSGGGSGSGGASSYGNERSRRGSERDPYGPPLPDRRGRTGGTSPSEGKASRQSTSPPHRDDSRPCIYALANLLINAKACDRGADCGYKHYRSKEDLRKARHAIDREALINVAKAARYVAKNGQSASTRLVEALESAL